MGEPAHHVADLRHLCRLRGGLHGDLEAAHPTKHRDWRRIWCHAARAGLGRDGGRGEPRGFDFVSHHFLVDAAAFLGFGAVPRGGLSQGGLAHVARHARQRIHALTNLALYLCVVGRLLDAVHLPHERLVLLGQRSDLELRVLWLRLGLVAQLLGRAGSQDFSLFFDSPQPAIRSTFDRSLPVMLLHSRRFLCSAFAVLALSACSPDQPKFNAIDITGADYAKGFTLTDHNGQSRSLTDFKGKVVVLFFGYTQCPDVCPTSMAELAEVKRLLGADGDKLQGVFVTVDPARDTAELLKAYIANFDPTFVAFIPTPEQLAAVAKDYKIYYKKVDGKTPTSYTVDHSAGSYVYDTQGNLRLYSRYGVGPQVLAQDIQTLLKTTP